ncbi:MAG TPA: hypothetical protein ENJ07_03470 [Gammaproteobacteria bacterium]|nr:hypothetical protein [Gammaproteobacteria bacterium]
MSAAQQIRLDTKLEALGFNHVQCQAALATIIARMVNPASELATHQWLQERSGLLVHTLRFQLKAQGIHLSWNGLRQKLMGQDRVTVLLKREDGKTLHVRKTTRAEQRQQIICDALGIEATPGQTEKTVID